MSQSNPAFVPLPVSAVPHGQQFVDQYGDICIRIKLADDDKAIVGLDGKGVVHEYDKNSFAACPLNREVLAATPELENLSEKLNPTED